MKSRSARLALLVLFVMALAVTAYLFKKSETARRAEAIAADGFTSKARLAARNLLELRAAQQAYVATGQGEDFWASRVSSTLASLRDSLTALRSSAASADALTSLDAVSGSLQDFAQMDARARDYVRTNQKMLASDMIFSNGSELTETALASLDKAANAEQAARNTAVETFANRQQFALLAAAAAASLVLLLLLPGVNTEAPAPSFLEPGVPVPTLAASRPLALSGGSPEGWSMARRAGDPVAASDESAAVASAAAAPAAPSAETVAQAPVPPEPGAAVAPVPVFDFTAVATLCTDLSRVDDTMSLSPLLERAAGLLDASGIILWIADPEGLELSPVLSQGYPQHLVNRLGTIPRGAENATAAAFRSGVLQTVYSEGMSSGAIAVPLVTYGGCVGVMAAEVRGDSERLEANLAAATILAAQLASLVGPAARSADPAVEAANA